MEFSPWASDQSLKELLPDEFTGYGLRTIDTTSLVFCEAQIKNFFNYFYSFNHYRVFIIAFVTLSPEFGENNFVLDI